MRKFITIIFILVLILLNFLNYTMYNEIKEIEMEIENLKEENNTKPDPEPIEYEPYPEPEPEEPDEEPEPEVKKENFEATAYCPCELCCGKWSGGPTKSGVMPKENRTIAVDPDVIPLGSKVKIEGVGVYVAEDTGSAVKGNIVDIYFSNHSEALSWGRQNVKLEVVE